MRNENAKTSNFNKCLWVWILLFRAHFWLSLCIQSRFIGECDWVLIFRANLRVGLGDSGCLEQIFRFVSFQNTSMSGCDCLEHFYRWMWLSVGGRENWKSQQIFCTSLSAITVSFFSANNFSEPQDPSAIEFSFNTLPR